MIGTLLGNYVIDQEIGRGAFGVVYRGHHQSDLQDQVAIKVLENNGRIEQQMAEPELLSRLKHPNIVRLREYFVHQNQLIIVLDYISGGDLKSALESGRVFSQGEVCEFIRSMASALEFAHARNIVHRDIKMANIMLEESFGELQFILTDFGIGRVEEGVQDRPNTGGTYLFMAPEQFRGRPVPQSDLWAVGVVAYCMLSGKMPFHGESLDELSRSILYSNPKAPSIAAGKPIDEKLDLLVAQLLEKSLNERVASAKELLRLVGTASGVTRAGGSVFQTLVGQKATTATESGMERMMQRLRRHRKIAIGFAFLFGIAIALGTGIVKGTMTTLGIGLFYWSQTKGHAHSRRWLIAACIALGIAWVDIAFKPDKVAKDKDEAAVSDIQFDSDLPGLLGATAIALGVFSRVSYPLFAMTIAAHRRISRKLVNCSLLIENPNSDPAYLDRMKAAVSERPNDLLFRMKYVEAMLSQDLLEDVVVECQLILEIDPYHFNANLILANALIELGLFDDAAKVCREYLDVSGYCFEFQMLLERCRSQGVLL